MIYKRRLNLRKFTSRFRTKVETEQPMSFNQSMFKSIEISPKRMTIIQMMKKNKLFWTKEFKKNIIFFYMSKI